MMPTASSPDVAALAKKYGLSSEAVQAALAALRAGGGRQAQFQHEELGGMGQWSAGGMTMIGDMFNSALKATVSALFDDLSPFAVERGIAAEIPSRWPAALGQPTSTGSQNDMHYAVFPATRRIAVEANGKRTIYDMGARELTGVSQQQSVGQDLVFSGPGGVVSLTDLSIVDDEVDVEVEADSETPSAEVPSAAAEVTGGAADKSLAGDVVAQIERLHDLLAKGALSQSEYDSAKARLLDRL